MEAISLLLFIGYTMSAASIERQVRDTPLFRGDSMIMGAVRAAERTGHAERTVRTGRTEHAGRTSSRQAARSAQN